MLSYTISADTAALQMLSGSQSVSYQLTSSFSAYTTGSEAYFSNGQTLTSNYTVSDSGSFSGSSSSSERSGPEFTRASYYESDGLGATTSESYRTDLYESARTVVQLFGGGPQTFTTLYRSGHTGWSSSANGAFTSGSNAIILNRIFDTTATTTVSYAMRTTTQSSRVVLFPSSTTGPGASTDTQTVSGSSSFSYPTSTTQSSTDSRLTIVTSTHPDSYEAIYNSWISQYVGAADICVVSQGGRFWDLSDRAFLINSNSILDSISHESQMSKITANATITLVKTLQTESVFVATGPLGGTGTTYIGLTTESFDSASYDTLTYHVLTFSEYPTTAYYQDLVLYTLSSAAVTHTYADAVTTTGLFNITRTKQMTAAASQALSDCTAVILAATTHTVEKVIGSNSQNSTLSTTVATTQTHAVKELCNRNEASSASTYSSVFAGSRTTQSGETYGGLFKGYNTHKRGRTCGGNVFQVFDAGVAPQGAFYAFPATGPVYEYSAGSGVVSFSANIPIVPEQIRSFNAPGRYVRGARIGRDRLLPRLAVQDAVYSENKSMTGPWHDALEIAGISQAKRVIPVGSFSYAVAPDISHEQAYTVSFGSFTARSLTKYFDDSFNVTSQSQTTETGQLAIVPGPSVGPALREDALVGESFYGFRKAVSDTGSSGQATIRLQPTRASFSLCFSDKPSVTLSVQPHFRATEMTTGGTATSTWTGQTLLTTAESSRAVAIANQAVFADAMASDPRGSSLVACNTWQTTHTPAAAFFSLSSYSP